MAFSPPTVMTVAIGFAILALVFGVVFMLQTRRDRRRAARLLDDATAHLERVERSLDRVSR
jgi:ABC-type transport system involved in cytochrome c biogenesis permease subunit